MEEKIICKSCGEKISGTYVNLGFSCTAALNCSKCESILFISDYDDVWNKYPKLKEAKFEPHNRHLLPYWNAIELEYENCDCGGSFNFMNPPRCPLCKGSLGRYTYEDKPILKQWDRYSFVCGKTYKGEEHKKQS